MRKLLGSALLLAVVAFVPQQLAGQRRAASRPAASSSDHPSFGVELDWNNDVNEGIGARGVFPLNGLIPRTPLDGIVSFDYFFPSAPSGASVHYWEINGDIAYRFAVPGSQLGPYLGGGLNIAHASASAAGVSTSDTKAGLNVLGGATLKLRGSHLLPFAEARGELGGGKEFVLTAGVRF
jgi:hypothetical protein